MNKESEVLGVLEFRCFHNVTLLNFCESIGFLLKLVPEKSQEKLEEIQLYVNQVIMFDYKFLATFPFKYLVGSSLYITLKVHQKIYGGILLKKLI